MDAVSFTEAKAHLSELFDRAEAGETIEVTRRGKPVGRIVPPERKLKPIDVGALRALTDRQKMQKSGIVREMRDSARY